VRVAGSGMALRDPVTLAQLIGFGVFLWLGVYLLTRVTVRTPAIVASIVGLFAQAAFFASSALSYNAVDLPQLQFLERVFWWTAVLPAAVWFHFACDAAARVPYARSRGRPLPAVPPAAIVVYTVAAVVIILGSMTNLFLRYSVPLGSAEDGLGTLGPGSFYVLYTVYLGLTAASAFANLARALWIAARSPDRADRLLAIQLRLLCGGGLLFLIGALWISSRYSWGLTLQVLPGYGFLLCGLAGLGYGVARFGLLLEGKNIERDFAYSLFGIGLINLLYVIVLNSVGPQPVGALLWLIGLVTVTHAAVDPGRNLLDRLFFTVAERSARAEARDYATDLGTAPIGAPVIAPEPEPEPEADLEPAQEQAGTEEVAPPAPPTAEVPAPPAMGTGDFEVGGEKAFKDLVRKALTNLKSPPQLAKSPLLGLSLVEERVRQNGLDDNRLHRVAALRELLIEQIDGLRPADGAASHTGDVWRFYNVLHYPYVRELSRKAALAEARRLEMERRRRGLREPDEHEQVLRWLADVDEDTFYKWQRRASDTIATALWEEHVKALGL
jgi:hypothetical protein